MESADNTFGSSSRSLDITLAEPGLSTHPPGEAERLTPGTKVGRYVVSTVLGVGGMGVVYAAHDPELDRPLALKLMLPEAARDPASADFHRRRLVREAQTAARLQHPNVITVHDVGTHDGQVFIAMELVDGVTLSRWLRERPQLSRILDAFVRAGEGLAAAHTAGLVHRDFKPDNVMIGRRGNVKVMDFGLARPATERLLPVRSRPNEPTLDMSQTGRLAGTPAYMAPEQHAGEAATHLSDQFAFCTSLYEAVYGERPFSGDNLLSLSYEVLEGNVRPAPSDSDVPAWLRRIILRGLAVDPDQRWPSMRALLQALHRRRRSRVRTLAVRSGAALTVGALGLLAFGASMPSTDCRRADDRLAEVWNRQRKADLRDAIFGRGNEFAATSWSEVSRTVDGYAERWSSIATSACKAGLAGKESAQRLDRRMQCLDDRLSSLDRMLAFLSEPRERLDETVVEVVNGLPSLDRCEDDEALALEVPPPDDPALLERVREVRIHLERVRALASAGELQSARSEAHRLWTSSRDLPYPPVVAEVGLAFGRALSDAGALEESVGVLEESFWLASAHRHDLVAADAASYLMYVEGVRRSDIERASAWKLQAKTAVSRLGAAGQAQYASYLLDLGLVTRRHGDLDEAYDLLAEAHGLRKSFDGPDHPRTVVVLQNMGAIRIEQGRFDEARRLLQSALDAIERTQGPDHPRAAAVAANLGALALSTGRFEEAEHLLQRAHTVGLTHLAPIEHAHVLANLGLVQQRLGRIDRAEQAYAEALQTLTEASQGDDEGLRATVLMRMADVALERGRFDRALALHEEALRERNGRVGAWDVALAEPLRGMGAAAMYLGDAARAEPHFRRALGILQSGLDVEDTRVAEARIELGRALLALDRSDEAEYQLELALGTREATLPAGHSLRAVALALLARVKLRRGDETGRELAERAVVLLERVEAPPGSLAEARLALAEALLQGPAEFRSRADALLELARAELRELGPRGEQALQSIERIARVSPRPAD